MNGRNRLLIRSISFGGLTKITGSLVVFIGLPVIAHSLSPEDYAAFLTTMSAASFTTLWLGAVVTLAVRTLASAVAGGSPDEIRAAEGSSQGLFLVSMLIALLVSIPVLIISGTYALGMAVIAVFLAAMTGVFLWGDSYRVALRTDHISSLWQLATNVIMLVLLISFSRYGILVVILLYFGIPALAQLAIVIQLYGERKFRFSPNLDISSLTSHLREVTPLLLNSLAEYGKIYASGLVLSAFVSANEYARYTTIVLLIARLSNPLSLITRPLMPAYLDARETNDQRWLRSAGRGLVGVALAGAVIMVIGCIVVRPSWLQWLLPPKLGSVSLFEIAFAAMFLWGVCLSNLVAPIFVVNRRFGLYATVNCSSVVVGCGLGVFLSRTGGGQAMLATMGTVSAIAGLMLTLIVARSLSGSSPHSVT